MTFSRLFNNLSSYTRIILILGLIVIASLGSQLGQVNVYAGKSTNACADKKPEPKNGQIECFVTFDNDTGGKFQTTAVYRENPTNKKYEFVQLTKCKLTGDIAGAEGINCAGFAIQELNIGDDIDRVGKITSGLAGSEQGNFFILNKNAVGANPKNFEQNICGDEISLDVDHTLYRCGSAKNLLNTQVIQNINTGKYSIKRGGTSAEDEKDTEIVDKIREDFKKGKVKGKNGELVNKSTLGGLAPTQFGDLTPEQITKINDQMEDNQQIIDIGAQSKPVITITCEVPKLDKNGNLTSVCKGSDGKYYGKDATGLIVLADKCIGVTYDANRNIKDKCLTEEANKTIATLPQNKTLQPIVAANKAEKDATAGTSGDKTSTVEDLLKSLGAIVGWVLFFLIYFVGWILAFVLFVISTLFVEILSINPAAPAFIGAAVRPWQVLVGLANLTVLGTFIAIGLGYILNYKPLKRNIREFMLQIAVFALLLNFSLLGTGVVVNLASGIGDVMVYSYAGAVKKTGRPNFPRLIGGFVKAINNISAIRCGKSVEPTKKAEFCDVNVSSVPFETDEKNGIANVTDSISNIGQFLGDTGTGKASGENFLFSATGQSILLQYLLFESIFVLVMFYAITQMFQAFGLVIFRLVGLWMLMVTSPIALALYLAPAKSLNKYASEWLDKFWKATFFYPFFILALVLHTKLVSAIAVALNIGQTLSAGTDSKDVSPISMAVIVAAGTLAGVSVVGLALVIKWFKDSFGAIVEAAMKGLGKAFGALKMASYAAGTALKVGGGGLNAAGSLLDKKVFGGNFRKGLASVKAQGEEIAARGGFFNQALGKSLKKASEVRLGSALGGAGNLFNFLPASVDTGTMLAKNSWAALKKANEAKVAGLKQGNLGNIEKAMRTMGLGAVADRIDGLKTLEGLTAQGMATQGSAEINKKFQDAQDDAVSNVLGAKFKNKTVARTVLEGLMEKARTQGADSFNSSERSQFQQLMKVGVDDTAMSSMLFGTEEGRAMSQSMFSSLDGETQRKIQEKYLGGLNDADAEQRAANLSEMEIKNLSSDSFKSAAVQRGLRRNANINDVDLDTRIRGANVSNFTNLEKSMGLDAGNPNNPFDQDTQDVYNQMRSVNMKPIAQATMGAYSSSVGQISDEIRTAGGKIDDSRIAEIITDNLTKSINKDFGSVTDASGNVSGIGNMNANDANLDVNISTMYNGMDLNSLQNLEHAKDLVKAAGPGYANLSDDQKTTVLREGMKVMATSVVKTRDTTQKSLETNAGIQAKASIKADGADSVRDNVINSVIPDYIGKNARVEDLRGDDQLRANLGAISTMDQVAKVIQSDQGSIAGIVDAQGNELDLSTALRGVRGNAKQAIETAFKQALEKKINTGDNTGFNDVLSKIQAIDPTIQASVDIDKLEASLNSSGRDVVDRLAANAAAQGGSIDAALINYRERESNKLDANRAAVYKKETEKIDPKLAAEYTDNSQPGAPEGTVSTSRKPFGDTYTPELPTGYDFQIGEQTQKAAQKAAAEQAKINAKAAAEAQAQAQKAAAAAQAAADKVRAKAEADARYADPSNNPFNPPTPPVTRR